jgi:hypothetical protein
MDVWDELAAKIGTRISGALLGGGTDGPDLADARAALAAGESWSTRGQARGFSSRAAALEAAKALGLQPGEYEITRRR